MFMRFLKWYFKQWKIVIKNLSRRSITTKKEEMEAAAVATMD